MTSNGTAVAHKPQTVNHQKQLRSCPAIIRGMAGNRGLTQSMPDESVMQISVKTLGQRPATPTRRGTAAVASTSCQLALLLHAAAFAAAAAHVNQFT